MKPIRAEIDRQIDAFEQAMGRPPDFVDGHQHVQILPDVRGWLIEALTKRGLAGRVWLRDSSDGVGAILARRVEATKALQVAMLAWGFGPAARAAGFQTNVGFAGFSSFDPSRSFRRDFARFLVAPGARPLIMCHPGHADSELAAVDEVLESRELELAYLLSPEFMADFAARGAALGRWRDAG